MTKRCLDEGTLQAYLDGELSQESAAEAAAHIAACDACAGALAGVEQETALFAAAFAPDESVSVPSEVLRSRISAAVARLEPAAEPDGAGSHGRNTGGFFASLAGLFSFTPQGAAAFVSLLAVVALAVIYFTAQRSQQQAPAGAQGTSEVARVGETPDRPSVQTTPETVAPVPPSSPDKVTTAATIPARFNHGARRADGRSSLKKQPTAPTAPKEEALPGEKDYRTAIASLEKTIKLGGDESLRPALRAEYERNLALLDSAISQTRQVAARNPKDEVAVGFLMSAYRSKVELLSKVADQAQVSALGR